MFVLLFPQIEPSVQKIVEPDRAGVADRPNSDKTTRIERMYSNCAPIADQLNIVIVGAGNG